MKDFVDDAHDAAYGPKNDKSKPAVSDDTRAKSITKNTSLGAMKGGIRGSSVVSSGKGKTHPGSSAGLRNETSAVLQVGSGSYGDLRKRDSSNIKTTKQKISNPIGSPRSGVSKINDYTRKGKSASCNSVGCLEKRMKLDRFK